MRSAPIRCTLAAFAIAAAAHAQFSKATILLSGSVTDSSSGRPLPARIQFFTGGAEANKVFTNTDGKYQAVLKPGTSYQARLVSERYYTAHVAVATPASTTFQEQSHDFVMRAIAAGTMLYGGPTFERGSTAPTAEAREAIAAVGRAMSENEEIEVAIETGADHPEDDQPWPAYDEGAQRARALKAILVGGGAGAQRIQLTVHEAGPAPAAAEEEPTGKGRKKKKKKAPPKKKRVVKKRGRNAPPPAPELTAATITIVKVHSLDE